MDRTDNVQKANEVAISSLTPVEVELINLFVQFARAFGQPRSIAELYGLLFVSEKPLPMDTLIERLNLSKGSASQGLKYLLDLGAIRTVYVAADRRTHYEAIAELRKLAGRFVRQQVLAQFEGSGLRLEHLASQTQNLSEGQQKHIAGRIELLRRWDRTGRRVLPFVLKMLGGE